MVAAILRNDDAEALLLDIRAGRNAAGRHLGDQGGAFLVFPTSIVTATGTGGQSVYPIRSDAEPGALVTAPGTAQVSGVVAGVTVTGAFHWALDEAAPPAKYQFRRRGRDQSPPSWAGQLPPSQSLPLVGPARLGRQQVRLQRRGRDAEHWLFTLTEQVIRRSCQGRIFQGIRYRPPIDLDDVVQRGLQAACRLLPLYVSPDRPPCSWLGMLRLDGHRDMHREVSRLDWLPADVAAAMRLADACGIGRGSDPAATLADLRTAAQRLGRAVPRVTAPSLDAAMRARGLFAQELRGTSAVPGPETDEVSDDRSESVVSTVARLVTNDAELISLAGAGDPRAVTRVGDQVVHRLCETRESPRLTRHRCWEEFLRSGQLFASATGLERFAPHADPLSLAAVDECLRRAARGHVLRVDG